jgi:hypothetical protein
MLCTAKPRKIMKILFLHGLESGVQGRKANYLRAHFKNVYVPDLMTGLYSWKQNSFMYQGLIHIPYLFSGSYFSHTILGALNGGVEIAQSAVLDCNPDLVIASSMGGAIALEAIKRGSISCPVILLAPALKRLVGIDQNTIETWYREFNEERQKIQKPERIIVISGVLDDTVLIDDSRELALRLLMEIIEVPDGDHSLNDYLLDGISKVTGQPQSNQLIRVIHDLMGEEKISHGKTF